MRVKDWIALYQKVAKGEASYQELCVAGKGTVFGEVLFDCYDIALIREGFAKYERGEVDEKYFKKWCYAYARAIKIGHKILVREEIAYRVISDILKEVAEGEKTPQAALQEIEYHDDILEGRRAPTGIDYTLSEDLECFYVEKDKDGVTIDAITFNHLAKVFAIYHNEHWLSIDGMDALGEDVDATRVSRIVFNALCKAAATTGYKEKDEV